MGTFKDLRAYQLAFDQCMKIFHLTKKFPSSERYMLTSQIIRSSRSICSNIAEGYRKRMYSPHFISKMSDADMENTETIVWIDIAFSSGYIDKETKERLLQTSTEIGNLLCYMITHPEKFNKNRV